MALSWQTGRHLHYLCNWASEAFVIFEFSWNLIVYLVRVQKIKKILCLWGQPVSSETYEGKYHYEIL